MLQLMEKTIIIPPILGEVILDDEPRIGCILYNNGDILGLRDEKDNVFIPNFDLTYMPDKFGLISKLSDLGIGVLRGSLDYECERELYDTKSQLLNPIRLYKGSGVFSSLESNIVEINYQNINHFNYSHPTHYDTFKYGLNLYIN